VDVLQRHRRHFWHATLRLRSGIFQQHPLQRAVLSYICCFRSIRWWCLRLCWTVLSHVMWGRPGCLFQSAGGEANRILLASALSSMRAMCPNRVSWRDWIIAVSLGCFVSFHCIIVPNKLVPFDAQQHMRTPLVEHVDPTCIHL